MSMAQRRAEDGATEVADRALSATLAVVTAAQTMAFKAVGAENFCGHWANSMA